MHNCPFGRRYSELKVDFSGSQFISNNIMLLFFACIGAGCNIFTAAAVGVPLFGFIAVLLLAQLIIAFLLGKAFRLPLWATLIGLNASAGGPATAFAMAASKGWKRFATCRTCWYDWICDWHLGWMFNE